MVQVIVNVILEYLLAVLLGGWFLKGLSGLCLLRVLGLPEEIVLSFEFVLVCEGALRLDLDQLHVYLAIFERLLS